MLPLSQFKLLANEFRLMLVDEAFLTGEGAPALAIETMLRLGDSLDRLAIEAAVVPADLRAAIEDLAAKLMSTAWHAQGSWLADVAANSVRPMLTAIVRSALVYANEAREPSMAGQTITPAGPVQLEPLPTEAPAFDESELPVEGAAAATDPEHEATEAE